MKVVLVRHIVRVWSHPRYPCRSCRCCRCARHAKRVCPARSTRTQHLTRHPKHLKGFPHWSYPMRLHLWLHSTSSRNPCYPVSYRIVSHTIASHCTAPRLTVPCCPFHRCNAHPRHPPSHRVGRSLGADLCLRFAWLLPAHAACSQTPCCTLCARVPRVSAGFIQE